MDLCIVTPVFNDWASFERLLGDLEDSLVDKCNFQVVAVNDDSYVPPPDGLLERDNLTVLNLICNLGHQRAIAIGLAYVADNIHCDAVVVMDADGEDKPSDIPTLIDASAAAPESIVVAGRGKRSEGAAFRLGYRLYRWMFRLFTGKQIRFGNFCLIPVGIVKRLVFQDSIWNHLAATVLRSRFNIEMVMTERGTRYQGESSMNSASLALLGLSAISVYSDVASLRTMMGAFLMSMVAITGILVTAGLRIFTDLAIPGWASNVVGSMTIILIQCVIVSVLVSFIVLANRSQRGFIVAHHYNEYLST